MRSGKISSSNIHYAFKILKPEVRRKLFFIFIIQSSLSILDLVGVALLGVVGAVSVRGIQSQNASGKSLQVLDLLNLSEFSFQGQVAALALSAAFLLIVRTFLSIYFSRRILFFLSAQSAEISANLISRLLGQSILDIRTRSTQEILYSLTNGVNAIVLGIIGSAISFLTDMVLFILIFSALVLVDPFMALLSLLVFSSIGFLLYFFLHQRARFLGIRDSQLSISSNEAILEVLNAFRETSVRGRQAFYANLIRNQRLGLSRITAELSFLPNISKYVLEISVLLGAILISGIQFLLSDSMHAISTLVVFLAAGTRVAPAILRAQQGAISIRSNAGTAGPTFDLISELTEVPFIEMKESFLELDHPNFVNSISIENISLKYQNNSDFSLSNISLTIAAGETVAIVGNSGAGKTSLVDVVLGLIEPNTGSILISGKSPKEAILEWPGAFGYVPQDVFIVDGSIRENISLGFNTGDANEKHYWDCLKLARLDDFVSTLPGGLDCQVGERGSKLSGGQRQRLGIARALFTNPKLIAFDESTSALDSETESEVASAISSLKGKVTVLIIAHRLSSIKMADKVIFMRAGRVIEMGTFEEVRRKVPDFDTQAKLLGL